MATPPVVDSETLYRQIGPGGDSIYFAPDRQPAVHHSLFRPSSADHDGLSLIRSRFRSPIWSAYRTEKPAVRYRLASLLVADLMTFADQVGFEEFRIDSTPDTLDEQHGEPWAHCVSREINHSDYARDAGRKKMIKEWALAVANSIAAVDTLGPFDAPTESDLYRP